MSEQVAALAQAAGRAANAGRWQEAEQLWLQVRAAEPNHPQALYSLGVHAFQRQDFKGADALLQQAHHAAPGDPMILHTLGVVRREAGDSAGEWQAIGASLAADAYFLPGLLAKGAFQERFGRTKAAAITFRNALRIAPPQWPEALRPQLEHARAAVDRYTAEFAAFLTQKLEAPRAALAPNATERWNEAASIMAGRTRPYHSDSNQLCVPRLPAIPFFDRADFPWVEALEAKTDVIRAELQAALAQDQAEFAPYIAYNPGEPVNQWRELNHSSRWSTYALWRGGVRVEEHLARCPETAKALEAVEMADIGGLCPNAMFSALAPHTEIPPHHGETNARLVVHLPLVVPDNCLYRVGFEERRWTVGEVLIFDDTIEHMARNDSDELRVVLIFDVWNPLLSKAEREMVKAMTAAAREFAAEG
jgi:aspartyl/asparaginyl beta-hydroxylase (cupin superfamily)